MTKFLVSGMIGFGLLVGPVVLSAQSSQDADMRRATQFQHQKDIDDARQAAIEKKHPSDMQMQSQAPRSTAMDPGPVSADRQSADRSADRQDMSGAARPASKYRTEPSSSELSKAVAWEHQKDAAAARQANQDRGKQ